MDTALKIVFLICVETIKLIIEKDFSYKSGSFETLVNLANEGLGMTLVPFLIFDLNEIEKTISQFNEPSPAREVSLIYHEAIKNAIN